MTPQSIGCSKKTKLNRIEKYWVIPSEPSAEIVAAMRTTPEVYTRPHDPAREAQIDYEYKRAGAANLFMHFAPLVLSYILLAGKDAKVWFWRPGL